MKVGFIGLGDQGRPMAEMIRAAGFDLAIWARRSSICDELAVRGIRVSETPAGLAQSVDMLCLCVTADRDVRDVLIDQGALAAMKRRSVIAIHSTISPATCMELERIASEQGISLLDIPVSGSGHAALSRSLLVMCGGDAQVVARVVPVLESYAGTILRMGNVGTAMNAKLINNLMAVVNIGHAYHALQLGRAVGVDPTALRHAVLAGTGRTFAMDLLERLQMPDKASHVLAILRKDVALAIAALPRDHMARWSPLAMTGLEALEQLASSRTTLLPPKKESNLHGEFVVHGNA